MTTPHRRMNKSLASSILENMTMKMTLSNRLRQAGIRECASDPGNKTNNLSQNGKKGLAKKCNERNKMLQNLNSDFYSSYYKDYYQNKMSGGKNLSKNYADFSKTLRRRIRGSAKKTIFASLNFIRDCQKYKKKVRTPKKRMELKREQKSESFSRNHKQSPCVKEEPQMLSQVSYWGNIKEEALNVDVLQDKEAENSCAIEFSFSNQNTEKVNMKEASINDEGKNQSHKKVSETLSNVKPFFDEFPSGDVARIDKKYLQSLLSIANRTDKNEEDEKKKNDETATEKHTEKKKKKKSHKDSPVSKIRINVVEESRDTAAEMQKDSENIQVSSYKDLVLVRTVRDSTKSEAQILIQKENKFYNKRNSEMKSEKNVTHIRSDINETRKKRKTRNKLIKNKSGEFSDLIFPNEIAKIVDVKELWRRDRREKSENSISSKSSTTIPKNDANPEQKNLELESYKVLMKFVEEEVKKISNESEKKNNLKKEGAEVENNFKTDEFNPVNPKESEKVKNVCKKLKISMPENPNEETNTTKTEMYDLKKELMQAVYPQHHSTNEGEKLNSTWSNVLAEGRLKDQRAEKKHIKERGKNCRKTPSQIIQNWSILNRLEQAFVALGTPNFQNKDIKNSKALKSENFVTNEKIRTEDTKKGQDRLEKINKKPQKNKETAEKGNNKDSANATNSTSGNEKQSFRSKNSESDGKRNLIKENQQKNNFKKNSKNESSQNNTLVNISKDEKNNPLKKKISHQTTRENFPKKPTVRSFAKSRVSDNELRHSKRKKEDVKIPSGGCSYVKMKKNESYQKKLPKMQHKKSEETLERKQTFDLVPKNDSSSMNPRKSKSCNKIDDNLESDRVKKRFLQTKNQERKNHDFFEKNLKCEPKSRGKSVENRTKNKPKPQTPKKLVKTPIRNKPETYQKPNSSREKECSKEFRENSVKVAKEKTYQEKHNEKAEITEEFPKQISARKESNSSNEKAVREHSALSIYKNHNNTQTTTKNFTQTEEKVASDFYPAPKSSTEKSQTNFDDLIQSSAQLVQSNCSIASSSSASSYKLLSTDSFEKHDGFVMIGSQPQNPLDISKKRIALCGSDNSASLSTQQAPGIEKKESEVKSLKCQPLWEQDIHHYHAVVKEIMSHYKRINGFLTQTDYSKCLPNDSADLLSANDAISDGTNENSGNLYGNSLNIDLHEYRKKIMSEYQALPIYEYKRKLQQKEERNLMSKEAKKRNLSVVKDVSKEMDLDVKDFQLKIQKVLNSQLYIDTENLVKRNQPNVKFEEKKSSLQEIVLGKNEKMVKQECIRSTSIPKTILLLPSSSDYFESSQTLKTIGSLQKDLTSTNTSLSYLEETESEIADDKVRIAQYCSL